MTNGAFSGFPVQTLQFLTDLGANNNRDWFNENRGAFDEFIIEPAREFVVALGEKIKVKRPHVQAIPAIDKSIFRVHRDTRFSKDKRPYKTHLGIFFWEGSGKKMECPGFYFHLETDRLMIGGGMHAMTPGQLAVYRKAIDDEKQGPKLESILKKGQGHFQSFEENSIEPYKRVPKGFPADHPRAEMLKQKGVVLGETMTIPKVLHSKKLIDFVYDRFEKMVPMHKWLLENIRQSEPS